MLTMVMAKPMQFTTVNAVPRALEGACFATIVENRGESATTTMPQKSKKIIKSHSEVCQNIKGEMMQHAAESSKAPAALFLVPQL